MADELCHNGYCTGLLPASRQCKGEQSEPLQYTHTHILRLNHSTYAPTNRSIGELQSCCGNHDNSSHRLQGLLRRCDLRELEYQTIRQQLCAHVR
ncbi:hypothetical protein SRHO_G00089560 [Serrasalmus rhombeus]